MSEMSEPLNDTGVYTAPDGRIYFIEVRDVVLTCDLDHEHEMDCYDPVPVPGSAGDSTEPPTA